jgi:hypothetical protein
MTFKATTNLNISAQEARRVVNQQIVTELGTGLIARDPKLATDGGRVVWRVPIVLSLPNHGDLGQVGTVDVDTDSGTLLIDTDEQKRIIQHTHKLYTGGISQTE